MRKRRTIVPEYTAWFGMKKRCYNPNFNGHHLYGDKGITVCDRWLNGTQSQTGYQCFLEDMGPKPSLQHSLDRIDGNLNYEPANCRWATRLEQGQNTTRIIWIEMDGEVIRFVDACRKHNTHVKTAANRIRSGWTIEDAIKMPLMPRGHRYVR